MSVLMNIDSVNKSYRKGKMQNHILKNVNMKIEKGKIITLLGESGGGKTTLAKLIIGLEELDTGEIFFKDRNLHKLKKRTFNDCVSIQYIFQDPYAALEEKTNVLKTLEEPVKLCKRNRKDYMKPEDALKMVGIQDKDFIYKKINTLSGGQRQKVCIARALITKPDFIIADECTAMLDEKSSKEIIRIFKRLNEDLNLTFLIITHNSYIIHNLSTEIYVMNKGKIIEFGNKYRILNSPKHQYTKKYIESMKKIEGGYKFGQNHTYRFNI